MDFFTRLYINLLECSYIFIFINSKLSCSSTELIFIRMFRENLAAYYASKYCTIIQCYRNTKINKSGMARIYTMSFTVTLFTSLFAFWTTSRQVYTELSEVIAVAYIFTIRSDSYCSESCTFSSVRHNLFELIHITKILYFHKTTPPVVLFIVK